MPSIRRRWRQVQCPGQARHERVQAIALALEGLSFVLGIPAKVVEHADVFAVLEPEALGCRVVTGAELQIDVADSADVLGDQAVQRLALLAADGDGGGGRRAPFGRGTETGLLMPRWGQRQYRLSRIEVSASVPRARAFQRARGTYLRIQRGPNVTRLRQESDAESTGMVQVSPWRVKLPVCRSVREWS